MQISSIVVIEDNNLFLGIQSSKGYGIIFPGGKLELNETPKQAAARELYEETGLVIDYNDLIFLLGAPDCSGFFCNSFIADLPDNSKLMESNEGRPDWYPKELFLISRYKGYYECLFDILDTTIRIPI